MIDKRLNICQVSMAGNIPTIKENSKNFKKFFKETNFFIICPSNEINEFKEKLNSSNYNIIDENTLITFEEFKNISNNFFKSNEFYNEIQDRLKWYYQQILKISFLLNFILEKKEPILMWDADTIILKPFNFFKKDFTIKYGTTFEFHRSYFETNKIILGKLPEYFIASTNQFIGLTPSEGKFLIKKFENLRVKNTNLSSWITEIIIDSISKSHKTYNGSMFSEQELIGQSNLLFSYENQKLIHGIRSDLNGKLTSFQTLIVKILNYNYVSYEYSHPNPKNKDMLLRYQTWGSFIKMIIKKTSNKFFRGIKHKINLILKP